MPYVCKFCKGRFCAAHRLPENHACQGLGAYRETIRKEGRIMGPAPGDEPIAPRVSTSARAWASMDAFWSKVDGKMTYVFLGVFIAVYLVEWAVFASAGEEALKNVFAVGTDALVRPWSIVTSIFAHSVYDISHIIFNSLGLLFFGHTVEKLIGTKRYTYLFLGAGVVAGLAQVFLMKLLFNTTSYALGASGALQGAMGTLAVLAPTLTVLVLFVIPAPLWALVILFVLYDLFFVVSQVDGNRVANIAHLAGLAVGLAYGWSLRRKGLRAVVRRAPPIWNR